MKKINRISTTYARMICSSKVTVMHTPLLTATFVAKLKDQKGYVDGLTGNKMREWGGTYDEVRRKSVNLSGKSSCFQEKTFDSFFI